MKFTNIVTASLISASVTQAAVIPQSNEDLAVRADSSDPISGLLGGLLGGGSGAPAPAPAPAPAASGSAIPQQAEATGGAAPPAGQQSAAAPSDPISQVIGLVSNVLEGGFSTSGALLHNLIG